MTLTKLGLEDYQLTDQRGIPVQASNLVLTQNGIHTFKLKVQSTSQNEVLNSLRVYPNPFNPYSDSIARQQVAFEYTTTSSTIRLMIYVG